MVAIVINVLILAVCAVALMRAPSRPWAYWLTLGVFVALALILSGLAGRKFGGGVGIVVLVVLSLLGRVYLRPHPVRMRGR